MTVELARNGLSIHRELVSNPIYYREALQYNGGGFYRAVLGFETLWDLKIEQDLNLSLDYFLTAHREKGLYYLSELTATKDFTLNGWKWFRGIPPDPAIFKTGMLWPMEVEEGDLFTARVNLLDHPFRVDIEKADGQITTIPYMRYKKLVARHFKIRKKGYDEKIPHKSRRRALPPLSTARRKPRLRVVKNHGNEIAIKKLDVELSYMPERQRR